MALPRAEADQSLYAAYIEVQRAVQTHKTTFAGFRERDLEQLEASSLIDRNLDNIRNPMNPKEVDREHPLEYVREESIPIQLLPTDNHSGIEYAYNRFSFPSYCGLEGHSKTVVAHLYRPNQKGTAPLVLKVSHLDVIKSYRPDERFCRFMAANGYACVYTERERLPSPDERNIMAAMQHNLRITSIEQRRVLDILCQNAKINCRAVFVSGISYGAWISVLVAGSDDRIRGVSLIGGGGNLARIFSRGSLPRKYEKTRKRMMQENAWDVEQLEQAWRKALYRLDPLDYASNIRAGSVLMLNIKGDTQIPPESIAELEQSFDNRGQVNSELLSPPWWNLIADLRHILGVHVNLGYYIETSERHFDSLREKLTQD